MAINTIIYSNANTSSKTVSLDFQADLLASSSNAVSDELRYFFKFNTTAKDEDGYNYQIRVVESLTDLVLNKQKQKIVNTADPYADINSMVLDYIYDYIYGHVAGEYSTSVTKKAPMDFSV